MSEIQLGAASHPERCVIAHPFNPPHLVAGRNRRGRQDVRRDDPACIENLCVDRQRTIRLNKSRN